MTSTAVTPTPEGPGLSQTARIVNTFVAPTKTFIDIRRSASWWAPWLLIAVVSVIFLAVVDRQIGFEQVSRNQIALSPSRTAQFDKLSPEQQQKQLQFAAKFTRIVSYSIPALTLLFSVVMAAVLMGTFNFGAGAAVRFKTALAIVIYAGLPGIIGALLGIVTLFAGVDPEGFNINNPLATNPAYFMDPAGNKFLYAMMSALDVFTIWSIVLMGIGFACNSKVKRSTAILIVLGWYLVYKVVSGGMAAAFS